MADGRNGNYDIYMYAFVSSPEAMLESLITEAAATEGVSRGTLKKLYDALKHLTAGRTTPAESRTIGESRGPAALPSFRALTAWRSGVGVRALTAGVLERKRPLLNLPARR